MIVLDIERSFIFGVGTPDVAVVGACMIAVESGVMLSTGPVGVLPIAVLHSTEGGLLWDSLKIKVTTTWEFGSPVVTTGWSVDSVVVPSCA